MCGIYRLSVNDSVCAAVSVIVVVMDNEQIDLQLSGKVLQITFFVAFRIAFRGVHITFAVHHFVISPVDDRVRRLRLP